MNVIALFADTVSDFLMRPRNMLRIKFVCCAAAAHFKSEGSEERGVGDAGALTLLLGFPISTGNNREGGGLTIDRTNQRLYAVNRDSNTVSAYAINPTTGAHAAAIQSNQSGFRNLGRHLTTFSINPLSGALTALSTQPVNTLGTSGLLTGIAYLAPPCQTITLSPFVLPGGTVGTAYNQTVTALPSGNYNFTVTAGALPAGLSLNAATGAITGTPTTVGTANFAITALSFGRAAAAKPTR